MSIARSSLVISTYNWPTALELVLKSVLAQEHLPNEILISAELRHIAQMLHGNVRANLFASP